MLPIISIATHSELDEFLSVARATYLETYSAMGEKPAGIVEAYVRELFTREKYAPRFKEGETSFPTLFLARSNGKTVGYAGLDGGEIPHSVPNQKSIGFSGVFILKEFQGLGLGTGLYEARVDLSKARGFSGAWLAVWNLNVRAIAFHERNGFKKVGEQDWTYTHSGKIWNCRDWVMAKDF